MIIFLHGPDDYRRAEKKKEYIDRFRTKYSALGMGEFDLEEEAGISDLENFLSSQSIFNAYKLAVLDDLFSAASDEKIAKALTAKIKSFIDTREMTILISEKTRTPPRGFGFLSKPPVVSYGFEILKGPEWVRFIEDEAKKRDVRFADSALSLAAEVYRGDSWRLVTELEKIGLLGKKTFDQKDLANLDIEAAPDFWALLNGLKSYNLSYRLQALERIFAQNEPPAKIFNILAYEWPEKLSDFADCDLAVKSGKLDYEEVLVDLVIS